MKKAIVSLAILSSFAQNSFGEEIKLWNNELGLIAAPFCEKVDEVYAVDSKLQIFSNSILSDGTHVQLVEEQGKPVAVSCLEDGKRQIFFFYKFESSIGEKVVGVSKADLKIFDNPGMIWKGEINSASTSLLSGLPSDVEIKTGAVDFVVCTSSNSLNVRDESLAKILFQVPRYASVKVIQSFGTDRFKKNIGGKDYFFVKAEFQASKVGWVAENYVVTRSECKGALTQPPPAVDVAQTWTFPTLLRPSVSYKDGMRRFKAGRSGGRLHAACDLYRVKDEKANVVSSGKVIRDKYYFYEGTYAIEVKHTGGKVARYGEITGKQAPSISLNANVVTGQTIGYIGKVNSGCCTPMLHFELYSGAASGSLSQSGNSFQRRKDLIDPTSLLSEWEKIKFGTSY